MRKGKEEREEGQRGEGRRRGRKKRGRDREQGKKEESGGSGVRDERREEESMTILV